MYSKFKDEAEFRDKYVKPLLNQMGFYSVHELHGQNEFGKDFIFSEINKFGLIKYAAGLIKHIESIKQTSNTVLQEILSQIRQAFAVPFKLTGTSTDLFISSVYIINSGEITDGAINYLLSETRKERYGENVFIFDSKKLDSINLWYTYNNDIDLRTRILGLKNQLEINRIILRSIIDCAGKDTFGEARGFLYASIENFLTFPLSKEIIDYNKLLLLWQTMKIIHEIYKRYFQKKNRPLEVKKNDMHQLDRLTKDVLQLISELELSINAILQKNRYIS